LSVASSRSLLHLYGSTSCRSLSAPEPARPQAVFHSDAGWSSLVLVGPITRESQTEIVLLLIYFVFPHSLLWYNARK
jgi:hypothetical protein